MLLMLAGWVGHTAGLAWASVFVVVGVAGMFSRSRVELLIGSAAMVLMLVASTGPLVLVLVVAMLPALSTLSVGALLRARAEAAGSADAVAPAVSAACRVGLNLAAVYMLVMMV